jgi:hypothetical protein
MGDFKWLLAGRKHESLLQLQSHTT